MKPVKVIFDTDIGNDCDDAGALALLHRLCDKGEAELLAATHCFSSSSVAGCIDAINRFYGRDVPIGINYEIHKKEQDVYDSKLCDLADSHSRCGSHRRRQRIGISLYRKKEERIYRNSLGNQRTSCRFACGKDLRHFRVLQSLVRYDASLPPAHLHRNNRS